MHDTLDGEDLSCEWVSWGILGTRDGVGEEEKELDVLALEVKVVVGRCREELIRQATTTQRPAVHTSQGRIHPRTRPSFLGNLLYSGQRTADSGQRRTAKQDHRGPQRTTEDDPSELFSPSFSLELLDQVCYRSGQ